MDSPRKIEINDWQYSPPRVSIRRRAPRRFLPPAMLGIVGTVLLHAIFVQALLFGSNQPKSKIPTNQISADARRTSSSDSDGLVITLLPANAIANQPISAGTVSSLADLSKMKIISPIDADSPQFLDFDTLALSEDQVSQPAANREEGAELARLSGMYSEQIKARIERAWRRPRTPVTESSVGELQSKDSFQCEAQIVQDARGYVQEVLLPRCNGSAGWQHSLVLAIEQSSPLPAPPSVKVFAQSISLHFVGLAYALGAAEDEYEIEAPRNFARQ